MHSGWVARKNKKHSYRLTIIYYKNTFWFNQATLLILNENRYKIGTLHITITLLKTL